MIAYVEFRYEAKCEKYQRMAIGFAVGGGIGTFYFLMFVPLGILINTYNFLSFFRVLVIILLVSIFLWGVATGMLCGIRIIRKSMFVFLVFIVVFIAELSTWIFVIDPYDYGSFTQTFISTYTHGFFDLIFIYSQPFIIGYLVGFIPTFLIRYTLKLYRKHLKHILEPC